MKKMKLIHVLVIILAFSSCKKAMNVDVPVEEEQEMMVSAFVGAGGAAYQDGIGEGAAFSRPNSLATDASGNIFVVDNKNNRIRKVTPEGVVSTFAGDGIEGFVNGPAATARFGQRNQIAIDGQNNIFLTDPQNSCIRKITPAGIVSTFIEADAGIDFDGQNPDITIDGSNNIYFLDKKGVRKVNADGSISTIVKNESEIALGSIATASIPNPLNICADKNGNIYVSSYFNFCNLFFKISNDGIVSLYAGSLTAEEGYQLGLAQIARFLNTRGIVADKLGNVFVLDNNHVITKITTDGFVRLVAGTQYTGSAQPFVPGPAFKAVFFDNTDITIDPNGIIYALEEEGSSIRKISAVDKSGNAETDKTNWNKPTGWK